MRKQIMIFIVAAVLVLGVALGWLTRPKMTMPTTGSAVQNGLRYLATIYTPYHYPDSYLEYVYPGEALACPLDGCTITYRTLDAFFDVRFLLEEVEAPELLKAQISDVEKTFAAILPEWRRANLYNAIASDGQPGVALDTACILGYTENDEVLADHVATFLTADGNLLKDDEYADDRWRNIADETWCIRLFARTGRQTHRLQELVQTKISEADQFLAHEQGEEFRIAVLFHMLYLLADLNDPHFTQKLRQYTEALAMLAADPAIAENTFTQANILDALARVRFDNRDVLDRLARSILLRQRADGSWTQTTRVALFPVFTTFRATLALNKYDRLLRGAPVE